jgi:hypothetical protein
MGHDFDELSYFILKLCRDIDENWGWERKKKKTISTKPERIWLNPPPSDGGAAMEIQTLLRMLMLGYNAYNVRKARTQPVWKRKPE